MKMMTAMILALGVMGVAKASDLNQNAFEALLNTPNLSVDGDVHSYETVQSIVESAVAAKANINNVCTAVKASKIAKCTLWITYKPIGETAIEYTVNLPGNTLATNIVYVSRGD